MVVLLPLLIGVIGVFVYFVFDKYPKVQELGRIAYFCGLFVFLLQGAERVVTLLK